MQVVRNGVTTATTAETGYAKIFRKHSKMFSKPYHIEYIIDHSCYPATWYNSRVAN